MRELQEGVIIHIGGGNGEGPSKYCNNFARTSGAAQKLALKAFNSNSNA
jgi:hypothetical protein